MIYRVYPSKDTVITNYKRNSVQQTGSNVGQCEILPLFKKAAVSGSISVAGSASISRILMSFNVSEIASLTASGDLPSNGSSYYLVVKNAQHAESLPSNYDIEVAPLSTDWDEGSGIDIDYFVDKGYANWIRPKSTTYWTSPGGDIISSASWTSTFHVDKGNEDLKVDITNVVNAWLSGTIPNYGLVVRLSSTLEPDTEYNDYYTKKFHSKDTSFLDKRPYIEVRGDNSVRDDRNNYYFNYTGSLYLYNNVRGILTNITELSTGSNVMTVRLQDLSGNLITTVSASHTGMTGIYSASFAIPTGSSYTGSKFSDVWFSGSKSYMTGTFSPKRGFALTSVYPSSYHVVVRGLKSEYESDEKARLNLFVKPNTYNPSVVASASLSVSQLGYVVTKGYYRIDNDATDEVVIPLGTGSYSGGVDWTRLSYDENGNYFWLWMNSLSRGNVYRVVFMFDVDGQKVHIDNGFKFKVT